jgi:hypothetical protein
MAEEEKSKDQKVQRGKGLWETVSGTQGNKPVGPMDAKEKRDSRILKAYEDRPSHRDEQKMKDMEDSVNKPPRSIGERIEGR